MKFSLDGFGKAEAVSRVMHCRKIGGILKALLNGENLKGDCARSLHAGVLVPMVIYGCETQMHIQ